jgi:hypothetical protein
MKGRRKLLFYFKMRHGEQVRVRKDPNGTHARPTRPCGACMCAPQVCARACGAEVRRPACVPHDGGSHQGPIYAPTEAFAPLMIGRALYKGAHTHAPPYFHLILGLQLLPCGYLLGSWVEVLGPTPTCCHFFHTN